MWKFFPCFFESFLLDSNTSYYFTFMIWEFSGVKISHQLGKKNELLSPGAREAVLLKNCTVYSFLFTEACTIYESSAWFCLNNISFLCHIKNEWALFKNYTCPETIKQTNKQYIWNRYFFYSKKFESYIHLPLEQAEGNIQNLIAR